MTPLRTSAMIFVVALLALGWLLRTPDGTPPPPVPPTERRDALRFDADGCLDVSVAAAGPLERSDADRWAPAGEGARLYEDACGAMWMLWFNSWRIAVRGDPMRIARLRMPDDGPLGALSGSGVADFVVVRGEVWVVGRRGDAARYRSGAWEPLPALRGCVDADLHVFDGDVWIACGADAQVTVAAWDGEANAWLPRAGHDVPAQRLTTDANGLLLAAGNGIVAAYTGPGHAWQRRASISVSPIGFAADAERIYVGTDDGLHVFAADGRALDVALRGLRVTGIAPDGEGGVWMSATDHGLHRFDGHAWHGWREADGLPDDEARDVAIDARRRLWLAGTHGGVIDADAAARRIEAMR